MKQRDPVAEGGCCIALSCMFPERQINELKPGIQSSSRFSVVFGHSLIYSRFDHFSDCHGVPEYIWIEYRLNKTGDKPGWEPTSTFASWCGRLRQQGRLDVSVKIPSCWSCCVYWTSGAEMVA